MLKSFEIIVPYKKFASTTNYFVILSNADILPTSLIHKRTCTKWPTPQVV